ncbi:MAG: DNA invertase Pin-like site-specific DNA recombinase [Rhodococcus sp. (in: high G+C Gram-positive bacteria)]|jgi:site-specific DNA recombinase
MEQKPSSAAVYVRISLDREDEAGVTRQREDCTKLAERLGWTIGQVYEDNSVSAFNRKKKRPEWLALLDALRSGEHDGLIAYDLDRVARQPRDLEDLIDAVELRKTPTAVVTGEVDLGTDNGVFLARLLVNVGNKASRDTGRRVARAAQQRAEQGKPQKAVSRPFGYTADYEMIEKEAKLIRDAYKRVVAGESLASILKEWKEVPTVNGKQWHRQTLKKILQAPRNAGLRVYKGEVIGKGNWEPIVDRAMWDATQKLFDERTQPMPDTSSVYLLSRIARCGKCGSPMYGRKANKTRKASYTCMSGLGGCGGINRQMLPVDKYVSGLVKRVMAKGKPVIEVVQDDGSAEIEAIELRIKELQQAWTDGLIAMSDFIPMRDAEDKKLKALRKSKAEISETKVAESFAENFDDANLSQQRALIKRYIEAVIIKPTTPGARKIDYKAIEIVWKQKG